MKHIFDTHAHYTDAAFDNDRLQLLSALPQQGVSGIIECGTNLATSAAAVALARQFPYLYAAAGMWPHEMAGAPADWLRQLERFAKERDIVAIGEIGLDYHYEDVSREKQLTAFEQQIHLARDYDLPIIVHDRDAHEDTLRLLQKHRPKGVVHCFSGSVEMAREIVKLGMYIGLGGAVTFKNAKKPVEVARQIPLDSLLLETDSPYMAPVPYRGARCDSSMIAATAQKIAAARQMDVQQLIDITTQNAKQLFRLEDNRQ